MFSTQHGVGSDGDGYDFTKSENVARWRGLFTPSLRRVLEQVHPCLTASEDALLYVETLCLRTLAMLCAKPLPHSVQDIEEKVLKIIPPPKDQSALKEAKEIHSKKKKSVLPTDRVHSLLQKDVLQYKIDSSVSLFLVAVLEYISADILKYAGNYVRYKNKNHCEITKQDIKVSMYADKGLVDMFCQSDNKSHVVANGPTFPTQRASTTYEDMVQDLINEEKQYQRDLHMIIRVFREELVKIVRDIKELEPIFSNIMDIYEVTVTLLGSLDDVIEMSQEQNALYVGSCFEELAEAEEFDVYTKYAHEVTSQQSREALTTLLDKKEAQSLMAAGQGFREAVRYYLPKLLLVPVWHAFVYFDYIKRLMELSPSQEDKDYFKQVQGLLRPLQCDLEKIVANLPTECCALNSSRIRRQLAIDRTRELQNTVEHWDKDVGQNCNEFIREDFLGKVGSGKRITERKVYLFDGLMVLCKANIKRQAPSAGAAVYEYRLKEKFVMRHVEINDRADTDELKNSFEIASRVHPPYVTILTAKNAQHKNDWMADLMMVHTKKMLEQTLNKILEDIEKKHPLRMPSPELYKFAIPDSSDNIILEDREMSGIQLIKGATLCKLVERLTYHLYADPMFVRTFLTTYRYFCTPQNLLTLLIERFNIPDPSLVYQDNQQCGDKDALNCDTDKMHKNSQREDWKRYRKEFMQPVQFRVLNVLRHWVDHHFYDFEKDPTLLEKLLYFLENVNGKSMRKWVDSVLKIVQRKKEQEKSHKQITFSYGHSPPPIEHHLNVPDSEINLLTLHPLELARQLTLLEFELYKNVKPSELVGSTPWTKKDKELKSPNLLKVSKHTTNVTHWIEKSIIEADNYEERVAMMTRAIEVMIVMRELNNFDGILAISAALGSASVHRLKFTFEGLPGRYAKDSEECRELYDGRLKKYQERLRKINPPCVPFFGRYLTNILHLEEGNPDFLPNTELINFSKQRKVSDIISEIQQYQNQPYCLMVDPKIRNFLETLDPFKGMSDTDINNYLYNESLRIEPKGCKQPPKFPRKWPSLPLKSPGTKPRRQNNSNNNSSGISGVSLIQSSLSFGARTQTHPSTIEPSSSSSSSSHNTSSTIACENSPPGTNVNSQNRSNLHAYSVFANVNIPERNSQWLQQNQTSVTPVHKTAVAAAAAAAATTTANIYDDQHYGDANGEVPLLPRKPSASAHIWSTGIGGDVAGAGNDKFSPSAYADGSGPTRLDAVWNLTDEMYAQQQQQHQQLITINNNAVTNDNETLPSSPLPKLVISPRYELHSAGNRSPFQSTAQQQLINKTNCSNASHFSPTDSIAAGNTPILMGSSTSPQLVEVDFNNPTVPVSPHVNVPTASNVEYRTAPPPLPPRRKERTESCADLAQKRQAPDAPTLPPRDGELSLSPPPIPPRLHHSIGTYTRSQTNEFTGSNSLLLPNTSSIMKRRNSAIEKRSAAATQGSMHTGKTAAGTLAPSSLSSSNSNSASGSSSLSSSLPLSAQLNTNINVKNNSSAMCLDEPQPSISPALSSSTTTSPMTPMTPISPYMPGHMSDAGYIQSYNSHQRFPHVIQDAQILHNKIAQQQHHQQQQQQQQQHLFQQHLLQQHHQQHSHSKAGGTTNTTTTNTIVGIVGSIQPLQPRTSPKDFFPLADGTPKLPPKPSLSGACYNNPDKGTMFLYPSTNQE